jgi:Ca-activated chloride channel homolog
MQLLQPLFLLALLTLPIIAALHIIRERRRRVAVPSLILWRGLPRKPEGKRLNRLPITPLLLLHLLIAALLALALAWPQLGALLPGAPVQTVVVLDTSTSMAASAGTGTRLERAVGEARELLRSLRGQDRATLIAMGPQARVLDAGGAEDLGRLSEALDALVPGGSGANLPEALTLAEAALRSGFESRILVLSDDALPPADLAGRAVAAEVEWRSLGDDAANRAIVAFAARPWSGDTRTQLYARVANFAEQPDVVTLRLFADGAQIDERSVSLDAGGQSEQTWTLDIQEGRLEARIDGDDALAADDAAVLQLAPRRPLEAVLVSDEPATLERALGALPEARVRVVAPASYAIDSAGAADLTIFDHVAPPAQLPAGGVLLIAPPLETPSARVLRLGVLPAAELRSRGTLLEGLSLGGVDFGPISFVEPPSWAESLLTAGETPLILRGRQGQSEVAIWAFGLRQGNLRGRLAFPLLVARTARDLTPPPLPATLAAGARLELRPSPRADTVELVAPDGASERRASAPLLALGPLSSPGIYRLRELDGDSTIYESFVAVNVGSGLESDLRPRPRPQIETREAPTAANGGRSEGRDLWPYLALLALAALLFEWVYVQRPQLARRAR